MDSAPLEGPELLRAMVDAYIARRRKGTAFDEIAAIQVYWEYEPRFAEGQANGFMDIGRTGSVDAWKLVLRRQLSRRRARRDPEAG